jgi:hypothetical protein
MSTSKNFTFFVFRILCINIASVYWADSIKMQIRNFIFTFLILSSFHKILKVVKNVFENMEIILSQLTKKNTHINKNFSAQT